LIIGRPEAVPSITRSYARKDTLPRVGVKMNVIPAKQCDTIARSRDPRRRQARS